MQPEPLQRGIMHTLQRNNLSEMDNVLEFPLIQCYNDKEFQQ